MNDTHTKPITDLGYENGWRTTPAIVEQCQAKGHQVEVEQPAGFRGGVHVVTCWECGYRFRYDTSG